MWWAGSWPGDDARRPSLARDQLVHPGAERVRSVGVAQLAEVGPQGSRRCRAEGAVVVRSTVRDDLGLDEDLLPRANRVAVVALSYRAWKGGHATTPSHDVSPSTGGATQ